MTRDEIQALQMLHAVASGHRVHVVSPTKADADRLFAAARKVTAQMGTPGEGRA